MTVDAELPDADSDLDGLLRDLARTPEVSSVNRRLKPGTILAARFQIAEQLGHGGMGRVYAAFDQRQATRVALKMLGAATPAAVLQIKSEFRNAAELNHPNLVRLHELFFDGVEWFFTMELVENITPAPVRVRSDQVGPLRLISLLRQLALALCELHRSGIVHGDLKPSNFIVTHEDRLVVLDFGLARPVATRHERYARSGSPGYMSPEQEDGTELTEASDWYAFGIVLHEALLGHRPSEPPPPRTALDPSLERLVPLALGLLERDPQRRPPAEAIALALGLDASVASRAERRDLAFVGRRSELATLHTALRAATDARRPAVVWVHGPSGIGKTTLVGHFVAAARQQGAFVLSGRCRERESVGHKAVDVLIDDLVAFIDSLPAAEAASLIPAGIGDLTRLFPALRAVSVIARAPNPNAQTSDQALARARAIGAFVELLSRLAARAPMVIWIDDLQWADAESALLLGPLLAQRSEAPILLVASVRTSGAIASPLVDALYAAKSELELPSPSEVQLAPLSAREATSLALRLLPADEPNARSLASTIAQDAAGHPLFLTELARAADVEGGEQRPLNLTTLMQRRVSALPRDACDLLEIMALAGAPLSRTVARIAKGFDSQRVERALDTLRAHRLVRTGGMQDDSDLDVLHDRIREIIVQGLAAPDRQRSHYALARALESQPGSRPDLVATHFEAAGALDEAGVHWIAAAHRAAHSLAFSRAAELYRLGAQHAVLDAAQRHAVHLQEAQMLSMAGRGAEAAELYLCAATGRPLNQALDLKCLAAQQLLLVGHLERGVQTADEVLRGFGLRGVPERVRLAELLLGRTRVRLRGYAYTERPEAALTSTELSRIDAAGALAASLGVVDPLRGSMLHVPHLRLALDAGEPNRVMRAMSLEASYIAGLAGGQKKTDAVLDIVERLSLQVSDRSVHGRMEMLRGLAQYSHGVVDLAMESFRRALDSFEAHCAGGVFFETVTAKRFLIGSLFYVGRFAELSRRLPVFLAEAASQGNLYATTTFRTHFGTIAWLTHDEVDEAKRQLAVARAEWTSPNFPVPLCAMFIGETYISLYCGEYAAAWRRLTEYWPAIESGQLLRIRLLRSQLWYLRAACAFGAALSAEADGDVRAGQRLRKAAGDAARRVRRQRAKHAEPLSSLLLASIDAAEGRREQAAQRLERCVVSMDGANLSLFAAVARLKLAQLRPAQAERLEALARAAFEREGVSRIDRMASMLAPG